MADDFEEESPRKRKKGKRFSGKAITILLSLLLIFSLGAAVEHYFVEPVVNEGLQNYSACMAQKTVSEQRFFDCAQQLEAVNSAKSACDYQLQQPAGTQ